MTAYQFDNNKLAIKSALEADRPNSRISRAVSIRIETLAAIVQSPTQNGMVEWVEVAKPTTALDEIALELFQNILDQTPDAPALVVLDYGKQ